MSEHCYGVLAEFTSAERLIEVVREARSEGYRQVEAYTPYFVDGLAEALALPPNRVPLLTLLGGIVVGAATFALQWYAAVVDYPINAGGRPLYSWPAFIPATFEMTVLGAALAAFFGMLALNGLPRLRHPVFEAPDFDLVSRNRFFICIRGDDPEFDLEHTSAWLTQRAPQRVVSVPVLPDIAS